MADFEIVVGDTPIFQLQLVQDDGVTPLADITGASVELRFKDGLASRIIEGSVLDGPLAKVDFAVPPGSFTASGQVFSRVRVTSLTGEVISVPASTNTLRIRVNPAVC